MEKPTRTSKALNFEYKIPAQRFIKSPVTDENANRWTYQIDLVVEKRPEYPAVPPSTWTLTLTVHKDGRVGKNLEPKGGPESLKSPGLVLVEWRARMGRMSWDAKDNMDRADFRQHIGPAGFKRELSKPLSKLVQDQGFSSHGGQPVLTSDPFVYVIVSLTFAESSMLADWKLLCDGRDFTAHRAILAARSPVFSAMFQQESKENVPEICTIKDISPDILDAMLKFFYSGELNNAEYGKFEALWNAADKYELADLKAECERLMMGSVNQDNADDYMSFAKNKGLKKLKVEAAKIISQEPT